MGFSLPPEIYQKIESLLKTSHKTRSEFMRQIIDSYLVAAQKTIESSHNEELQVSADDINKILKLYYQLIGSQSQKKKTIVVGLGIVVKEGKVLIGQRRKKDPYVKELTWVFPGGKFESLDFESELIKSIKEETGLNVYVNQLIHARQVPDSPEKKVKIIALYYHCTPVSGKEYAGGDLKKLEWVEPMKIFHYFTTSTADEVVSFLGSI